jgi:hypothetical protein
VEAHSSGGHYLREVAPKMQGQCVPAYAKDWVGSMLAVFLERVATGATTRLGELRSAPKISPSGILSLQIKRCYESYIYNA